MLKSLLAVVVPVLLAAFVAAQDLTINTPYVPFFVLRGAC